jgi:hypothetical protein
VLWTSAVGPRCIAADRDAFNPLSTDDVTVPAPAGEGTGERVPPTSAATAVAVV